MTSTLLWTTITRDWTSHALFILSTLMFLRF